MKTLRAAGILAGFMSVIFDDDSGLMHAGEQWVSRNYKIGSHSHEHWELYLQASGESTWHSAGTPLKVAPNSLYIAPPGVIHSMDENLPTKHHFLFASIDVEAVLARLKDAPPPWPANKVIYIEDASTVITPFRLLIREVSLDLPYRSAGVRAALDALIIESSRLLFRCASAARSKTSFEHPAVSYARQLMEHNLNRNWKVSDLAEIAGISERHLAETFTRDTGVSPHQYLLEQRISAAEVYLRGGDLSITEIALELGFSSSQYFATAFKRSRGFPPKALRSQQRRDGIQP
jgi:AraC-like DNA-binding protein